MVIQKNVNYDEWAITYAIVNGNLEMLKWLYNELKCPYNEYISSYYAVFSNSIEILEWLYKNNIKIHEYSYATAIDYNNINILNWLYQKNKIYKFNS